jgi:hypothetical protein
VLRQHIDTRTRGRKGGRPSKLTTDHIREARRMLDDGKTVAEVAEVGAGSGGGRGGAFDTARGHYADNVVVLAVSA